METLVVGEGSLDLRVVAKAIERSTSFALLLPKWRLFGEELDLKDEVILELQLKLSNETYGISELPRKILKIWRANQGKNATLEKLYGALEECRVRDIAETLKAKFGKVESDEGPFFSIQNRVYTLKQLLVENASGKLYKQIQEKYKVSRPDKRIPLLREAVSPKKAPEYYIFRTFLCMTELDEQVFRNDLTKEHIFVVKGASQSVLARASGFQMIESSRNQLNELTVRFITLEYEKDFERICKISTKPVHVIMCKNGRFYWLKSTRGINAIRPFLKQTTSNLQQHDPLSYLPEDEISFYTVGEMEVAQKITSLEPSSAISIAESPGMGKTFVLNNLAEIVGEAYSNAVSIFIVLQELVKQTYYTNSPGCVHVDHILRYATTDYTKRSILKQMLESNLYQFYLFFDGYDEVFQENLPFVDSIFEHLLKLRNVKIIVTTRKHFQSRLEELFNSISLEMLPFKESDQIDFLIKYWTTIHGAEESETLKEFAMECLNQLLEVMTDWERNIAGTPLQCMILADVYAEDAKQASEQDQLSENAIKIVSFFHTYKSLVDLKFSKLSDSVTRKKCRDVHIYEAVSLLFPAYLEKLKSYITPAHEIGEVTLYTVGLIEHSPRDNNLRFIHRTFAEYIFADFIIQHLDKHEIFVEIIIEAFSVTPPSFESQYWKRPLWWDFKHPIIGYFVHMCLQDRIKNNHTHELPHLDLLNLQNIADEDLCIAAMSCCYNGFEASFNLIAYCIKRSSSFKRDNDELKNKYLKHLPNIVVKNTNSVSFLKAALAFIKLEFGIGLRHYIYEELRFADEVFNSTPLHVAVKEGKYNFVMYLLQEYGNDVLSAKYLLHACVRDTAGLNNSVIEAKKSIIQALIQLNKEWLEEEFDGSTPLLQRDIHVEIAQQLVKLGTNINAHSSMDGNILNTGGDKNSYMDLVRWALSNGFNLNCHKNENGQICFTDAIRFGKMNTEVLGIFHETGVDFNYQDQKGDSVLFYALRDSKSIDLIRKMLDFGANLSHRNQRERNAAHLLLGRKYSLCNNLTHRDQYICYPYSNFPCKYA